MCAVYIYYVCICIYTYTYIYIYIYINYTYTHIYIYIHACIFQKNWLFIYNINYMNINMHVNIFKIYTMCVYLYIHYKYTQNTHIYYANKTKM